jgi:hypothetical protein
MLYLLEVGATEPGKLNRASFSASRSFNYIESLSGIEKNHANLLKVPPRFQLH